MGGTIVNTDGLTKQYAAVTALADCSLRIQRGEVFGLLGPNGSGKTTLLRLLMGFLRPTSGTATIDGLDCYRDSAVLHARVSYLPGEPRLFRRMSGRNVLKFFSGVRADGDLDRAIGLAEQLHLDLSRQVATSSTGMRQKLALSIVLSADAPLLILDEPTSSLDPTARRSVLTWVREAREAGRTVVFSSHVLTEIEEVCDRVAVLRKGRLVHTQVMSQLRRRHRIRATLNGPMRDLPDHLENVTVQTSDDGEMQLETPGDLAPLLSWLAELQLSEVRIEPVGLRAVYDQFHGEDGDGGSP